LISANSGPRYELKPGRFSSHGRILRLAAAWARTDRILEVGTATGYLGRELRRLGFTELVGLDVDPSFAEIAKPHYSDYFVVDLEEASLPDRVRDFDVLLCADVLEHLRDPQVALGALARRVKPGGRVIVSVPNVANWTLRLSLLAGRFTYRDRGLLDRGHVRFFTYRTARELIEGAGCAIERCEPTAIPLTYVLGETVPVGIARAAEAAYFGASLAWKRLFAYQFVFVARLEATRQVSKARA